jgi:ankyrin repeat protein
MADKSTLENFLRLLKKKSLKLNEVKQFLKNHTLDLNQCDKSGYNALHYAIKSEKPELVKIMLPSENEEENSLSTLADPNKETNDKVNHIYTSPLLLSLLYTNDESTSNQMIRYLCNAGAKINYRDEEGTTLFLHSCEKGRTDIINFLIKKITKDDNEISQNDEEKDKKKMTVKDLINESSKNGGGLHFAIIGQQDDIIELLLENNIDLNICNSQGDNALEYALKEKQMNSFKVILDYIVDNKEMTNEEKKKILNHQNNDGNTILHELAFCKSSIVTNMILKLPKEFGVDPDIKNKEGYDYKQVSENVIELEKRKIEQENLLKEERRKLKEELRQKKYEEEKKVIDEQKRYEEQIRRQEEFGQKLIQNRGKIFTGVLIIFLGLMFLIIKYASVKRERVI